MGIGQSSKAPVTNSTDEGQYYTVYKIQSSQKLEATLKPLLRCSCSFVDQGKAPVTDDKDDGHHQSYIIFISTQLNYRQYYIFLL